MRFKTNSANYQLFIVIDECAVQTLPGRTDRRLCGWACSDGPSGAEYDRPLTALSIRHMRLQKGNLDVPQLPIVMDDEVGVVTRSFNQMLESIREHRPAQGKAWAAGADEGTRAYDGGTP